MRRILRRHEIVPDDWHHLEEAPAEADSVIVPWAKLRDEPDRWRQWSGRLGVRLSPADRVEELEPQLHRLSLVAAEFPGPGEGRGYTQARLLRTRYRFSGELRAVGAVKQDQVFFMARSGFDSFELAPGEDPEAARQALERYSVAYQPGAAHPSIRRQRLHN